MVFRFSSGFVFVKTIDVSHNKYGANYIKNVWVKRALSCRQLQWSHMSKTVEKPASKSPNTEPFQIPVFCDGSQDWWWFIKLTFTKLMRIVSDRVVF